MEEEELLRQAGQWLQSVRDKAGVSQAKVAGRAEVNVVHLSRIENGHTRTSEATLLEIIKAINELTTEPFKINPYDALVKFDFIKRSDTHRPPKPQNVAEFMDRLRDMGFEITFDADLRDLGPDDLQDLIDDIEAKLLFKTSRREKKTTTNEYLPRQTAALHTGIQ